MNEGWKMAQGPVRVVHFYPKRPLGQLLYKPKNLNFPRGYDLGGTRQRAVGWVARDLTHKNIFWHQKKLEAGDLGGKSYGKFVIFCCLNLEPSTLGSWNSFEKSDDFNEFQLRRAMVTERFQSVKSTGRRALRGVGDPRLQLWLDVWTYEQNDIWYTVFGNDWKQMTH